MLSDKSLFAKRFADAYPEVRYRTEKVKEARSDKLIRIGEVNKAAYERSFIGEPVNILVEEIIQKNRENYFRGHTERYMLIDVNCTDYLSKASPDLMNNIPEDYINKIITVTHSM